VDGLPQRILLVCRSLPCHVRGGIEHHVVDLGAGLLAEGAQVGLLTTPVSPADREALEAAGFHLHEVPGVAPGRYTRAYFRAVGAAIDAAVAGENYELVHGQEFGLGLWRAPREKPPRVAVTVHGTITSETALHPDVFRALTFGGRVGAVRRYGRRLLFAPIWTRMLHRAGRILVDSEFTARELQRIRPGIMARVRVVPLGVDMARYPFIAGDAARAELGWPADGPPQLLTVGRLEWQKGHDLALRALAQLGALPWTYRIVGEGSARGSIERLVAELGLEGRVTLTGRVDDDTKSRMLAAADLFIWPERTHPAFGLVGLEAMLMNTPVLGARRGAIPELIDASSGWTHEAESPEALAAALEPLLREPTRLRVAAEGLRERAMARFAPGAMARRTLEVYRELF
jgi:glycosyltransferase involved in cell wall biosynthesis